MRGVSTTAWLLLTCGALASCSRANDAAAPDGGGPETGSAGSEPSRDSGARANGTGGTHGRADAGRSPAGTTASTRHDAATTATTPTDSGVHGDGDAGAVRVPPPVVHPCASLPAPGKWESITPAAALAPYEKPTGPSTAGIVGVVPHPRDSGTAFMGTVNRGLFRSTDCGASWNHVNTGTHGADLDTGAVILTIDPVDPDVMYATLNYGATGFWKSTNAGVDWSYALSDEVKNTFQYSFVEGAGMDPSDPSHLVISPHGGCTGTYAPSCMAETTDGARTWRLFAAPAWEEGSVVVIVSRKTWLLLTVFNGIQQTKDAGATWSKLPGVGGAYSALYRNDAGRYFLPSPAGIITSLDAETWDVISGSPSNTPAFVGTGTSFFACGFSWNPVHCTSAPEQTQGATWKEAPVPSDLAAIGALSFANLSFDRGHKLLYGAVIDNGATTFQGGAWRMVVP